MTTWRFECAQERDGTGDWRWVCLLPDGMRCTGERRFDAYRECEADAEAHGCPKHGSR